MDLALKVVGGVFVCLGLLLLFKPAVGTTLLKFFGHGKRIYVGGVVRLVLAVLFLLAARGCNHPWIIGLFGIVFLGGGLVIFLAGPERLKPVVVWFQGQSPVRRRVAGAIVLVLGAVIIYAV
jgi:hypothetical protein